jgi:hypothetical protein
MERNELKAEFKKLLNGKCLECEIAIDDITMVVGVYQSKLTNEVNFYLEGDCVVEFDDIDLNTLYSIFKALKK